MRQELRRPQIVDVPFRLEWTRKITRINTGMAASWIRLGPEFYSFPPSSASATLMIGRQICVTVFGLRGCLTEAAAPTSDTQRPLFLIPYSRKITADVRLCVHCGTETVNPDKGTQTKNYSHFNPIPCSSSVLPELRHVLERPQLLLVARGHPRSPELEGPNVARRPVQLGFPCLLLLQHLFKL